MKAGLIGITALVLWVLVGDGIYENIQGRLQTCIDRKRDEYNFKGISDYDSSHKFNYYYDTCRNRLGLNKEDWPKAIWLKILAAPGYVING
jgi:hypothetical protein